MAVYGIDVSKWQGVINWAQVASDSIDRYGDKPTFAFIKATEGNGYTDPDFGRNAVGAAAAGLVVGFYHFARPDLGNTPEAEAAWFVRVVAPFMRPGELAALDLEVQGGNYAEWARRWLAAVRAALGFEPVFYTYRSYFAAHGISFASIGSQAGLWLAAPGPESAPGPMAGWPVLAFWQEGTKTLPGISGAVDFDAFLGDRTALLKYGKPGLNSAGDHTVNPPAPQPAPAPTPAPAPQPGASGDEIEDRDHTATEGGVRGHGGSMASTDPTPAPVLAPDQPEPGIVAEAGVSTSEWKLALVYLAQAAALGTADAVNVVAQAVWHTSVTIPAPLMQLAVNLEFAAAAVAVSYIVSRGIRKFGTSK